ncbi:MAG: hypothetical protein JSV86_13575 [Gemmatimonadota bacterium]|nr:MAG: hypothetical protein JSV86_13575 [Gemmatimonadota bacterium]
MRNTRTALLIVPLLLLACDREPVAPDTPTPDTPTPSFSATHGEFVVEGTDDATFFVSCANDGLGEMVHFEGPFRISGTTVTSSSGNWLGKAEAYEYLDGHQVTGLTSGDVWTQVKLQMNLFAYFLANGNLVRHATYLEHFENQDGDRLFTNTLSFWTIANGEYRVERREVVACRLY